MAKLSRTKEYAIKYLNSQGLSNADISSELKIPISDVESLLGSVETKKEKKADKTKDLMIRQTSSKKQNTVSIMTEAAAQLSDEFVKNIDFHKKRTQDFIFRPRD